MRGLTIKAKRTRAPLARGPLEPIVRPCLKIVVAFPGTVRIMETVDRTHQPPGDEKMIISRKQLAVALSYGPVEVAKIGKAVQSALNLWVSRGEVVIEGGMVRLA